MRYSKPDLKKVKSKGQPLAANFSPPPAGGDDSSCKACPISQKDKKVAVKKF